MGKQIGEIRHMAHSFGFIRANGIDHFFYRTAVDITCGVPFDQYRKGDRVEFTPIDGPKGPKAIEVRKL